MKKVNVIKIVQHGRFYGKKIGFVCGRCRCHYEITLGDMANADPSLIIHNRLDFYDVSYDCPECGQTNTIVTNYDMSYFE